MYTSQFNGPPSPPFRQFRGRRKGGFWGRIPLKDKLVILGLFLGLVSGFGCALWFMFGGEGEAQTEQQATAKAQTKAAQNLPTLTATPPEIAERRPSPTAISASRSARLGM